MDTIHSVKQRRIALICRVVGNALFLCAIFLMWRNDIAMEVAPPCFIFAAGVGVLLLSSIKTLEAQISRLELMIKQ